jgi:quinolinate synthase
VAEARLEYPEAEIVAHPECPQAVLAMSDFVGSTSAMVEYCARSQAREFIVMTESGIRFSLDRAAPGKRFHFVANEQCNCSECPYMKLNTLEKLRNCLLNLEPRVELDPETMRKALEPLERMLALR